MSASGAAPRPAGGMAAGAASRPSPAGPERPAEGPAGWTFLTNHGHVIVAISREPGLRQRDISQQVGITEGAVQRILDDLEAAGYVRRHRQGRRNRYEVIADRPLRHPLEQPRTVQDLLDAVEA